MIKIVSIHSNVAGSSNLTDGHSWIGLTYENGKKATVGLWTRSLGETRRFVKDRIGILDNSEENFDVEWNMEMKKRYIPVASRYYSTSPVQAMKAIKVMGGYEGWRYTNTCATWATGVIFGIFGQKLDSAELLGLTNTPRALGAAILREEGRRATSPDNPLTV